MYTLQWDDAYVIGQPLIDQQHQMLFQLANRVFHISQEHNQRHALQEVFAALFDYTERHFHDEEEVWQSLEATLCRQHRERHRQLKQSLEAIWSEDSIFAIAETLNRLYDWMQELVDHITQFDRFMNQQIAVNS